MSDNTEGFFGGALFGAVMVGIIWVACDLISRPAIPVIEISTWDFNCYAISTEHFRMDDGEIGSRTVCDAYIRKYSDSEKFMQKQGVWSVTVLRK